MAKKKTDPHGDQSFMNLVLSQDEYLSLTADAARTGDTDAAREILSDFVGAIDQHSKRSWEQSGSNAVCYAYAQYLAEAFRDILNGKDAALALGVKSSKKGRRKGGTTFNEEALAAAYWYLIRQGLRPQQAKVALSDKTGADTRTIERASTAKGNIAYKSPKLIDDESLKVTFKPYASAINKILANK